MKATPTIPVKLTDIREKDEYIAEAEVIRDEYLSAKQDKLRQKKTGSQVGPALTMRQRILALSLFPNLYNKHFVMTHGS